MLILNINGPINSGKTTVSKILSEQLEDALFIEVDDLLGDDEELELGLSMQQGWAERLNRLENLLHREVQRRQYKIVIFAYPMTLNIYTRFKALERDDIRFINVTLSPAMDVCLTNRGGRELTPWEIKRIRQMYREKYHHPDFADLIVDNSAQTPEETALIIREFVCAEN